MGTGYFDSALAEAGMHLAKILLWIDVFAIIAGLLTLPLFLLVLLTIRSWFWAVDETSNPPPEGTRHSAARRAGALVLTFGVPIMSFVCTLFVIAYFGVLDLGSSSPRPPIKQAVQRAYERATRSVADVFVSDAPIVADPSSSVPVEEQIEQIKEQRAKGPVQGVRVVSMLFVLLVGPFPTLVVLLCLAVGRKGVTLIFRSLSRNLLRTSLSYLAVFVLVLVVTAIWSILAMLAKVTAEKESNLKVILTEAYQIPSQMPPSHLGRLKALVDELPPELQPVNGDDDYMSWSFIAGTLDPTQRTMENMVFFFCMEPRKFLSMMPGIEDLTEEQVEQVRKACAKMEQDIKSVVIGTERLRKMNKHVGERITLTALNFPGLTFELEIIGELPEGRYAQAAVMNQAYLERSLDDYAGRTGAPHPVADKALALVWLRMPNKLAFETLAAKVAGGGRFNPAVKLETESSSTQTWLESVKDMLWFLRWLLTPALLAMMALVICNAITISVRERRTETAVLKVLGFRPWMVMALVLGEALLVGILSGFMATATAYAIINSYGGIPMRVGWFPAFQIPAEGLWWGPAIGAGMSLLGSLLPAWSARSVKVSEVFAKVA
jgi:putative ABC transport system permease protein